MAEADQKAEQDWRAEAERAEETPLAVARRRAHEPGRGREAASPEEIPARGWGDILWRFLYAVPEDRVLSTAGGVAFFSLLAFFPALATVVSLYGLFADAAVVYTHLRLLDGVVPDGVLDLLAAELQRVTSQRSNTLGIAFVIGLLIAFWSANSGVGALFDALNVVYKEREKRSLLRFYGTTFLFTLGFVLFIIIAVAGVVLLPAWLARFGVSTTAEVVLGIARWPVLLVTVMLGLGLLYRYGPSRKVAKWRWISWGSVMAALLWVAASMLFSWYVSSFDSYNRIYGSLGAGVGFVTWIWISAIVVLLGAELNAQIEHQTAKDTTEGWPKPLGRRGAVVADTVGEAQS